MADVLAGINTRHTSQTERADTRQERNNAGGFTFTVDQATRLRRFMTLGTEGTYYVSAEDLTKENAAVVLDMARNHTAELVAEIVAVSTAGRAPKQNPALFALAAAASLGNDDGRRAALDVLPLVARTGTHLFLFARYIEQFRGWGRGLRRAIGRWYTEKPVEDIAFQTVKYRQREGWSHRDLLRLAHPSTDDDTRRRLFDWICGRDTSVEGLRVIEGFQRVQTASPKQAAALIGEYALSWEMLPDNLLGETVVWEALLDQGMPQTALMRQLPRLTRLGLLSPLGPRTSAVAAQLMNEERLEKARVHPISVLLAQRTYASGRGTRGSARWKPSQPIVDALDAAFYAAFGAVEPARKRMMLALDVSGSMMSPISGMPISYREASAALALVTAATEQRYEIVGFTSGSDKSSSASNTALTPLSISPRQRLDDAVQAVSDLPFGATDCSLPMLHALKSRTEVDAFAVFTDSETWSGRVHPHQALRQYRDRMGIDAKLIVVAMTATRFSIAEPGNPAMLDVSGFDAAVPTLISDFARGL